MLKKLFSGKNKEEMSDVKKEEIQLEITGMTCDHCATGIETKFTGKKGIIDKQVSYPEGKGNFVFDPDKISKKEIIDTTVINDYHDNLCRWVLPN